MQNQRSMSFISSGVFWGGIIVLIGLSIILREVFHINLPFVRIIFGLLLIYWGIKMIAGGFFQGSSRNATVFNTADMNYDAKSKEYDIVFGRGTIDLFKMEVPATTKKIEVSVVFGDGKVIINDSIPMKIEMQTVFGASVIPDKNVNAFGKSFHTTTAFKEGSPYVLLETNTVFGRLEVVSKNW